MPIERWAAMQFQPRGAPVPALESIDPNEVRLDCDFNGRLPVNGWEIGRIGQNLGRDFRERVQPGWRVKRGRLRLSVWLKKE